MKFKRCFHFPFFLLPKLFAFEQETRGAGQAHIAIVALGGNIDNPREHLERAMAKLEARGNDWKILARSRWIETVPVGYKNQPNFTNGALAICVPAEISPEEFLAILLEIERGEGRERPFPNAPRTCDLDLLFFDDETRDSKFLRLPHPRWRERTFVLVPLIEVLEQLGGNAFAGTLDEARLALRKLGNAGTQI